MTDDIDEATEWFEVLPAAMGVEGLVVKGAASRYTGRRAAWVKGQFSRGGGQCRTLLFVEVRTASGWLRLLRHLSWTAGGWVPCGLLQQPGCAAGDVDIYFERGAAVDDSGDPITITGVDAATVGRVAYAAGIELLWLAESTGDLERLFFSLTSPRSTPGAAGIASDVGAP